VPGLSVAVVQQGRVSMTKGFGLADIENKVPATADTVYRIASLSKSITATAAMKLVEMGKINLDAPIQKYCPAFPQKPWPITTRELLTH
jgi:CubicO group peptidase (beta-lactamase class C family)